MKKIIILLGAALLGSCGIWKPYSRPDDLRTGDLYGPGVETADTASIAYMKWYELFTDPLLQQLIRTGLDNNADINLARLSVEQAHAALKSARLSYVPSFFFSPEGAVSSFDTRKATQVYTIPLAVSWEADLLGKQTNAKRRSKAAYEQSVEYRNAVRSWLMAVIADHYYTLLMLDEQYAISAETARSWERSVGTMRLMKEAGMVTEAAVAQTAANYYSIEASLYDLRESINRLENSLSVLLFDTPDSIARGRLDGQYFPERLSYGVPVQLLANRPDVRSAELALVQAYYSTAEARAALYPSLVLAGSAGWTNSVGSAIVNPGKLLLSAAASLTQPIFNRRLNRTQLEIARAAQEQAAIQFQQALLNAGAEVNGALTQYQTARDKRPYIENQITSLEDAVESTKLLMAHGSTTYLEILTAEQALLGARLADVANTYDQIQGIINLYNALGGGVE
ncbi:MAG: TolC family protein [Rikenellaceae bacterium]|nr:TolC family protein [Rikenellaceae bacterium]